MSDSDLTTRLELALEAAREAGAITLKHFQQDGLEVMLKSDQSPVTAADQEAERVLRDRIGSRFPQDGIVGEEYGETPGSSSYRWVLDPIDGTKSFIQGVPLYGTLVGVELEGRGVVGVILAPALGECVYAARGAGAWYEKAGSPRREARTSGLEKLDRAVFLTTDAVAFGARGAADVCRQLEERTKMSRTWGDCYGYLLVATGRADLMVDPGLHVWDAAALQPVLEESGGAFASWAGEPTIHGGDGIGAASPSLLAEALAIVNR